MDIPHLDLWEKYILAHARCQPQKGSGVEIPAEVGVAMSLFNANNVTGDTVIVDHADYWHAIYSQGHVSNLILMYAIGGHQYDNVRYDLTMCHLDYVLNNEETFADWKDAAWLDDIFTGKTSYNVLLPMMVKWLRTTMTDAEYIRYQQILPFYFYLGDYTKLPKTRMELRTCMYSLLSGTLIFGDKSWQGVYYDISKARFVFRNMVIHADELFSLDKTRLQKQVNWLTFTVFKNNGDDEQIRHDVGNWLAFGAYITLLSKYQRYALNAEGFKDAKSFVGAEVTNYYRKLRERIG